MNGAADEPVTVTLSPAAAGAGRVNTHPSTPWVAGAPGQVTVNSVSVAPRPPGAALRMVPVAVYAAAGVAGMSTVAATRPAVTAARRTRRWDFTGCSPLRRARL